MLVFLAAFRKYETEIPIKLAGISDPLEKFCAAVRAYCECVGDNLDSTLIAYQESKSLRPERRKIVQELELKTNALISRPLKACVKGGLLACANVDLATFHLIMHAHGWALKNWFFREKISLNGYIEEGLNAFLQSALTPSGWAHWRSLMSAGNR